MLQQLSDNIPKNTAYFAPNISIATPNVVDSNFAIDVQYGVTRSINDSPLAAAVCATQAISQSFAKTLCAIYFHQKYFLKNSFNVDWAE